MAAVAVVVEVGRSGGVVPCCGNMAVVAGVVVTNIIVAVVVYTNTSNIRHSKHTQLCDWN